MPCPRGVAVSGLWDEAVGAREADRVVVAPRLCVQVNGVHVLALVLELPRKVVGCGAVASRGDNLRCLLKVTLAHTQRRPSDGRGGERG